MANQNLYLQDWRGGLSDDEKAGPQGSFSSGKALNFRNSPTKATVHRALQKESGSVVDTEIHDAVRISGGDVYLAGGTKIYKRSPGANGAAGTYSVSSSSSSLGTVRDLDYRPDVDALFLYHRDTIHEYSPLSNSPTYSYDKYTAYTASSNSESGGTYSLPSSINEAQLFSFTCEAEPMFGVTVNVSTRGTGDWTLTIHDSANHTLATKTATNAEIPASGTLQFSLDNPLRLNIGATYHYHLTSSNSTGAIVTGASNTLGDADTTIKAYRLVNAGDYGHFTFQSGNKTYICNERYLAEWEILSVEANSASGYNAHRLVFPAECIAIGIAQWNEYIAIACGIRRGTDSTNDIPTEGIIFFWNLTDELPSFPLPVPQGAPFGINSINNELRWTSNGRCYRWNGGDIEMYFEFEGVDEFEPTSGGPQTEVFLRAARHSAAVKDSLFYTGFPYQTANTNTKIGVYSYGNTKGYMPRAIGFDYLLSTGSETTQFDTGTSPSTPVTGITMLKSFGNNLIVAWKDKVGGSVTYGVDYINDTSPAATSARYLSLWFDNGKPDKEKTAVALQVDMLALPAGCTITPIIEYDRSGTVVSGEDSATAGDTKVRMTMHQRYREARFGFDVTSTSGNFPEIISVSHEFDDNEQEGFST